MNITQEFNWLVYRIGQQHNRNSQKLDTFTFPVENRSLGTLKEFHITIGDYVIDCYPVGTFVYCYPRKDKSDISLRDVEVSQK